MDDWTALLLGNFLARLSYALIRSPVLPLYVLGLGAAPWLIGLIGAVAGILGAGCRPLAGWWSDRAGKSGVMRTGAVLFTVGPLLYPLARISVLLLVPIRALHAQAPALLTPASLAWAGERSEPQRAENLGRLSQIRSLATIVGTLLGGWLLTRLGFFRLFVASALVAAPVALLVPRPRGQGARPADPPSHPIAALRDGQLWRLSLPAMATYGAQSGLYIFLPLACARLGWGALATGGLVALHFAAQAAGAPAFGRLADRGAGPWLPTVCLLGAAGSLAAFSVFPSPPSALAAALLTGAAVAAVGPPSLAKATAHLPWTKGTVAGAWAALVDLGEAAGPLLCGITASIAGQPRGSFLPWVALLALSALGNHRRHGHSLGVGDAQMPPPDAARGGGGGSMPG